MADLDTKKIIIQSHDKVSHSVFDCSAPYLAIVYLIFIVFFFITIFKSIM